MPSWRHESGKPGQQAVPATRAKAVGFDGCNQPSPNLAISRALRLRLAAMSAAAFYPRFAEPRLTEALADTPVVLIHGPRQCGKTTLARMAGEARGYAYFSFDDSAVLAAAQSDPAGFVGDLPDRTILDEVQRAPWLFTAIKTAVERRRPGGSS